MRLCFQSARFDDSAILVEVDASVFEDVSVDWRGLLPWSRQKVCFQIVLENRT